jgi:hypothetical protein
MNSQNIRKLLYNQNVGKLLYNQNIGKLLYNQNIGKYYVTKTLENCYISVNVCDWGRRRRGGEPRAAARAAIDARDPANVITCSRERGIRIEIVPPSGAGGLTCRLARIDKRSTSSFSH